MRGKKMSVSAFAGEKSREAQKEEDAFEYAPGRSFLSGGAGFDHPRSASRCLSILAGILRRADRTKHYAVK
jgi:hypothetical protein